MEVQFDFKVWHRITSSRRKTSRISALVAVSFSDSACSVFPVPCSVAGLAQTPWHGIPRGTLAQGEPLGGRVINYLLEKCRVVNQTPGERNFHIFYHLLGSGNTPLLQAMQLTADADAYHYTRQGDASKVESIDDRRDFQDVLAAFKEMDFDKVEVQVGPAPALVLWLPLVVCRLLLPLVYVCHLSFLSLVVRCPLVIARRLKCSCFCIDAAGSLLHCRVDSPPRPSAVRGPE